MDDATTVPTDADLQQRCAEIILWQRTGVLPGNALRAYAALHWAGHFDSLQMAERDTSAQAMEAIARWGAQPAPAASPAPLTRQQLREAYHRSTGCTLGNDIRLAERVCSVVEQARGITSTAAPRS